MIRPGLAPARACKADLRGGRDPRRGKFSAASENVTVLSGVFLIGHGEEFDQGTGQELPAGGFVSVLPNPRTTRGRAVRRPSCRCTAWDRPISGS